MFDFLKKTTPKIDASTKVITTNGCMLWRWLSPECVLKNVYNDLDEVQKLYLATLYDLRLEHRRTTIEDEIEIALLEYWQHNRTDKGRFWHIEVSAHGIDTPLSSYFIDINSTVLDMDVESFDVEVAKPTARRLVCVLSQHRCTEVIRVQLHLTRKDSLP